MTQIPLFQPPSEWLPPERIPELREAKEIAIDLEKSNKERQTIESMLSEEVNLVVKNITTIQY